jgi:hypothetical protein
MKVLITECPQRPGDRSRNLKWFWNLCQIRWPGSLCNEETTLKWTQEEWELAATGKKYPGYDVTVNEALLEKVDVVIGFEMAGATMNSLTNLNIPWVNVVLYPVRFGPDLLFGIKMFGGTFSFLPTDWEDIFRQWACIEKARAAHRAWVSPGRFSLVIGQVQGDRSLIDSANLNTLAFPEGSNTHFKKHPLDTSLFVPRWPLLEGPIYSILASEDLDWAGGWNSSVLLEASFFGAKVKQFGPAWWQDYTPISINQFLQTELYPGALRRSIIEKWGFDS